MTSETGMDRRGALGLLGMLGLAGLGLAGCGDDDAQAEAVAAEAGNTARRECASARP